jgi:hypothetical protein
VCNENAKLKNNSTGGLPYCGRAKGGSNRKSAVSRTYGVKREKPKGASARSEACARRSNPVPAISPGFYLALETSYGDQVFVLSTNKSLKLGRYGETVLVLPKGIY